MKHFLFVFIWTYLAVSCAVSGTIYFYRDESGCFHFTDMPTSSKFKPFLFFKDSSSLGRKKVLQLVDNYSRIYGVDKHLIQAVIQVESGFAAQAVSKAGAQGLMQIMPETGKDLGLDTPFEPEANIEAGVRYLRSMLDKFKDVSLALAAYNAGPGQVQRYGGIPPFAETKSYVNKVLGLQAKLKNKR